MLEIRLMGRRRDRRGDGSDSESDERVTFSTGPDDKEVWIEVGGRCISVGKREFIAVAKTLDSYSLVRPESFAASAPRRSGP